MAIVFNSPQDRFGLQEGLGALAQTMAQQNLERRQQQYLLNAEQRAEEQRIRAEQRDLQNRLESEKRQAEARQKYGSVLSEAMKIVQDPTASTMEKVGALQQYATISGDTKGVAPILNQILKQSSRQEESQAALGFLKAMGIDVPDNLPPSSLPPTSFLGAFSQGLKPTFEPESEKIEAKRSADFADQIVKDYGAAEMSKNRLAQMDIAAKSGQLPKPALVKAMDHIGIPISVFSNPLAETYEKNVNEYIKDISNYFPGAIRVAEIDSYMKTIPTLLNSDEGKQIIIDNQRLLNEQKEAAYDAYKQILKENRGRKPRNLDVEILERTKQKREDVSERLKENFERAVTISKYPTGKVNAGTRLTPDVALNYLNAAGGNRKKAEEMARKDGYGF